MGILWEVWGLDHNFRKSLGWTLNTHYQILTSSLDYDQTNKKINCYSYGHQNENIMNKTSKNLRNVFEFNFWKSSGKTKPQKKQPWKSLHLYRAIIVQIKGCQSTKILKVLRSCQNKQTKIQPSKVTPKLHGTNQNMCSDLIKACISVCHLT